MTVLKWLEKAIEKLEVASVPTARLDAEVLLADILDKDRSWLHSHLEYVLQRSDLRELDSQIERRMTHEPLAYIRGRQEFYGYEFIVSPDTLTPRPETETMVEIALKIIKEKNIESVADLGTGSGCIVISLSLESKGPIEFTGYDTSIVALEIARKNAKKMGAKITFLEADITKNESSGWQNSEMIVANLPYVPDDFHINLAATREPESAIFGGKDGLDFYRIMFKKLSDQTKYVLTESLPPQHAKLKAIAKEAGFKLQKTQDLIQLYVRK